MTESLMTDQATTTTEGETASQTTGQNEATAEALYGDQQQADGAQDQQAQDDASAEESEGDQGEETSEEQSEGAPEKYEFKAPEGQEFDAEIIDSFSEIAKELDLSQEAAQKLVDKMAPRIAERQAEQLEVIRNDWAQAAQVDKEFGGDKLNENLGIAKKALDGFGTPELRALLNESGLGNHPEIIRFMYRAGKAISEDSFVGSSTGAGGKPVPKDFNSKAAQLYSNQ